MLSVYFYVVDTGELQLHYEQGRMGNLQGADLGKRIEVTKHLTGMYLVAINSCSSIKTVQIKKIIHFKCIAMYLKF